MWLKIVSTYCTCLWCWLNLLESSVSIWFQCVMDFKHPDGRHVPVLLPSRCFVVMTGESRYMWTHGITPRKSDIIPVTVEIPGESGDSKIEVSRLTRSTRSVRTSLTFRKLRDGPCKCGNCFSYSWITCNVSSKYNTTTRLQKSVFGLSLKL